VYENYPTDTAALSGDHELAITELSGRDYYHYRLPSKPGRATNWTFASNIVRTFSTWPTSKR